VVNDRPPPRPRIPRQADQLYKANKPGVGPVTGPDAKPDAGVDRFRDSFSASREVHGTRYSRAVTAPAPRSFQQTDLEAAGFVGWQTWDELRAAGFAAVPTDPAAYIVYRPSSSGPTFLKTSPAGHHKGKNPTESIDVLEKNWVPTSRVVYVGKANVANRRLSELARFGAGANVGHKGGRYIWQLADSDDLLVAWHVIDWGETASGYET
jgi:hypothetical protein